MKPIREIISRDIIEDLWGAGYTILPRARHPDPFYLAPEMIPASRSYQWMHLVHDKSLIDVDTGWALVPASRHDGYFMPAGHIGGIEVSWLGLFEKPKFEIDQAHQAAAAAAHKLVDGWKEKWGKGFSGEVSVGGEKSTVGETAKFPDSKSIELITKVPRDMTVHMAAIFAERDALYTDLVDCWNSMAPLNDQQLGIRKQYEVVLDADPGMQKAAALNALLLPIAIENVRNRISEDSNDQAS